MFCLACRLEALPACGLGALPPAENPADFQRPPGYFGQEEAGGLI